MAKTAAELEEELSELLHACSLSARGLFHEMRLLIDKETRRLRGTGAPNARPGHLLLNGRPMSGVQLANLAGCSHDEASRAIAELTAAGTVETDVHGTMILPQVTRIGEKLQARAASQRKSAAKSVGRGVSDDTPSDTHLTGKGEPDPRPQVSPPRTPSSYPHPREGLAGASKSAGGVRKPADVPIPPTLDTPAFREAWAIFLRHRGNSRDKFTADAAVLNLRKCEAMGPERAVVAIEHSVANGWRGVFEPRPEKGNHHGKSAATNGGQHRAGQFEQTVTVKTFQRRGGSGASPAGSDRQGAGPVDVRQAVTAGSGSGPGDREAGDA